MTAGVSNIKDRALPLTREEFVRFTPVEVGDYFDRQKEKDETSLGLFTEGHHWCASSRESFLPQSIIKEHMRERKNDVDVDMELLDFTRTIQAVTTQNWQITGFVIEKRGGLYVICASNGRIAYEIVKRCSVRATITDHEMPEMTGLDLIKSIRERERSGSFQRMGIALNSALLESESGSAAVQALKICEEIDCVLPIKIFLRDFLLASNPEESISSKVGGSTRTPLGLIP